MIDGKGKRWVDGHLTKARDHGRWFSISINSSKPKEWYGHGHIEGKVSTEWFDLGRVELLEGKNTIEIRFLEPVPDMHTGSFGIDYLEFRN